MIFCPSGKGSILHRDAIRVIEAVQNNIKRRWVGFSVPDNYATKPRLRLYCNGLIPPERSPRPLLVVPADVAVDPFRQQALSARIPQGSLDGCHALSISLNKRQRGLSIVSASPLNCVTSKVEGIKASEPSGSEAFFLHCYPKKNSLTNSLEIGRHYRACAFS